MCALVPAPLFQLGVVPAGHPLAAAAAMHLHDLVPPPLNSVEIRYAF